MDNHPMDGRKYIVGWLKLKPGRREAVLAIARAYVEACRREPGCLFFEMVPSLDDPDGLVIAECFADAAAHATHLETLGFASFWNVLNREGVSGRFENIIAGQVTPDGARFDGDTAAEVNPS